MSLVLLFLQGNIKILYIPSVPNQKMPTIGN